MPVDSSQIGCLGSQARPSPQGTRQRRGPGSQLPPGQSTSAVHSTHLPSRASHTPLPHSASLRHSTQRRSSARQYGRGPEQCASCVHSTQRPPRSHAGSLGARQCSSSRHITHRSSSPLHCVVGDPAQSLGSVQRGAHSFNTGLQSWFAGHSAAVRQATHWLPTHAGRARSQSASTRHITHSPRAHQARSLGQSRSERHSAASCWFAGNSSRVRPSYTLQLAAQSPAATSSHGKRHGLIALAARPPARHAQSRADGAPGTVAPPRSPRRLAPARAASESA